MNTGSQGLDTLAALCGGASQSATQQHRMLLNNYLPTGTMETDAMAVSAAIKQSPDNHAGLNDALLSPNLAGQQWLQYLASFACPHSSDAPFPGMNLAAAAAYQPEGGAATNNNVAAAFYQLLYSLQGQYQPFVQAAQASQLAQQFIHQQQQQMKIAATSPGAAAVMHRTNSVNSSLSMSTTSTGSRSLNDNGQQQTSFQPTLFVSGGSGCVVNSTMDNAAASKALTGVGDSLAHVRQISFTQQHPEKNPNDAVVRSVVDIESYCNNSSTTEMILESYSLPDSSTTVVVVVEKKELKRAANRRSAQLSRKRKKHLFEELQEENDDLRRKEHILRSVPDLIVMFDSAGRFSFVSDSVSNLVDFKPSDLEGTSFWHRLCDESVRLLKAAFMDALATLTPEMDTMPLGDGLWELRLKDKDGSLRLVTLNGVVHFSSDLPECVCSIRPKVMSPNKCRGSAEEKTTPAVDCSQSKADACNDVLLIKPKQSVMIGVTTDSSLSVSASKDLVHR